MLALHSEHPSSILPFDTALDGQGNLRLGTFAPIGFDGGEPRRVIVIAQTAISLTNSSRQQVGVTSPTL